MSGALEKLLSKYSFAKAEEEEFIPSGSVVFDGVLSQGRGIPKGKFIQISSESGVGKCVSGNTMVAMDGKMGYIKNFIPSDLDGFAEHHRKVLSIKDGVSDYLESAYDYREVVDLTYSIVTEENYTLKGTADHKVMVIDGDKALWKPLSMINVGDQVYLSPKYLTSITLDNSFVRLGVNLAIPSSIVFKDHIPASYLSFIEEFLPDDYTQSEMASRDGVTYSIRFTKKPFKLDDSMLITPDQFISLLLGVMSIQDSFIRGTISSKYTELISFLQKGCNLLGIRSRRSDSGLELSFRNSDIEYMRKLMCGESVVIPSKVETSVVTVRYMKEERVPVYDFTVPDYHAFNTQGLLSHNTTMVLYMCKKACDNGGKVIYIDAERGVNESQLEGVGLTKYLGTQFFLCDVSTYEDADTIITEALKDSEVVYIVIDSITMLSSAKTLANNVEKTEIGLDARLTAVFLKKFKALLRSSANNPTFIFINQQRVKFKGFIAVTTAAGGNAQSFNMDIRLTLKATQKLFKQVETAEGTQKIPYGAEVMIVPDKNRYNFGATGTMMVVYGKGISNLEAYITYLKYYGALTQGGANFTLSLPGHEPIKACGKVAMKDMIKKNFGEVKKYIEAQGGFGILPKDDNGNIVGEEVAYKSKKSGDSDD